MAVSNINPVPQVPTTPVTPAVSAAGAGVITSIASSGSTHELLKRMSFELWTKHSDLMHEVGKSLPSGESIPLKTLPETIERIKNYIRELLRAQGQAKTFFNETPQTRKEMLAKHPETELFFLFKKAIRSSIEAAALYYCHLEGLRECFSKEKNRSVPETFRFNKISREILESIFFEDRRLFINELNPIAKGANGDVLPADVGDRGLVIKFPIEGGTEVQRNTFLNEGFMHSRIPDSPYLLPLIFYYGKSGLAFPRGTSDLLRVKYGIKKLELWGYQILKGLQALHGANVVHSDLKPENVILRDGRAMITDFGSAQENKRPFIGGTVEYLDPTLHAVLRGDKTKTVEYANDIWSLGVLILSMLLCRDSFSPEEIISLPTISQEDFSTLINEKICIECPLEWIQSKLVKLVQKCLKLDPAERSSAAELLEHFYPTSPEEAMSSSSIATGEPSTPDATVPSPILFPPPAAAASSSAATSAAAASSAAAATSSLSASPTPHSPPLSLAATPGPY